MAGPGAAWHALSSPSGEPRRADAAVPAPMAVDSNGDGFEEVIDLTDLASRPSVGFVIRGDSEGDWAGISVASAGDINGDGFDDIIVGARYGDDGGTDAGEAYVIFGREGGFATIDLSALGLAGLIIRGGDAGDLAGGSVASAGDFNGDGYDDMLVGAQTAESGRTDSGEAYLIGGWELASGTIDVSSLAGYGITIQGAAAGDRAGRSVASAGDFNNDGFDDLIIGAPLSDGGGPADGLAGAAYLVFGKDVGIANVDLNALGANGFAILSSHAGDYGGWSVASAGDVNGDGFDDLVIGAQFADGGGEDSGAAYVVFGKASGFGTIDLNALGAAGFAIQGDDAYDRTGYSVASAGDVNGDGFDDIIVGAISGNSGGYSSGEAYVIFGKASGFGNIDLSSLGAAGFLIQGDSAGDLAGVSVASAGDVNGDGFDDIIVGARGGDDGGSGAGEAYVVFGKASGFGTVDLSSLGTGGFVIQGDSAGDAAGISVASAGDVNGDGFDDVIVGARGGDDGGADAGEAYVIFGQAPTAAVTRIGSAIGQTIRGGAQGDTIDGLEGDDQLFGAGGDDSIDGGDGSDLIEGGDGNDLLDGGAGDDSVYGDDGNDTLSATGGGDWLFGGLGDDILTATSGSFNLFGDEGGSSEEDGNDHLTLTLGGTNSWLAAGGGNDVIHASGSGMILADGGTGDDDITIEGYSNGNVNLQDNDTLRLPTGFFTLNLFNGRDSITITSTGAGFITLIGFDAGEQGDRLDLSIYGADPFGTGTLVMGGNGASTFIDHVATNMRYVLQDVRSVNLSAYNLGVPNPNYAPQGMTLDDAFADHPELEVAGELIGADGNDLIRGYGGNDRLFGSGGNDQLEGGNGVDRLDGGSGSDTASYSDAAKAVIASLGKRWLNTGDAKGDVYVSIENL
ncbi:MAG TPA: hypothetical protein VJS15_08315, partial [Allosphingosinicella sp.]|nr:hypothetical protein [Allosphingosinicella sp.]